MRGTYFFLTKFGDTALEFAGEDVLDESLLILCVSAFEMLLSFALGLELLLGLILFTSLPESARQPADSLDESGLAREAVSFNISTPL